MMHVMADVFTILLFYDVFMTVNLLPFTNRASLQTIYLYLYFLFMLMFRKQTNKQQKKDLKKKIKKIKQHIQPTLSMTYMQIPKR